MMIFQRFILMKRLIFLPFIAIPVLVIGCASSPDVPTATVNTPTPKQPKIALVLGGGGAKGFAHIGVLEALEAHHIKPDIIIGTSSGAMVGAIYSSGKSAHELRKIAQTLDERELIDITPSKQGLIEGEKLAQFVNTQVNFTPIENLGIRFMAVATEQKTGKAVGFGLGDTGQAVRASASVPRLFIAPRLPKHGGQKYVDGGQSALVPARFAKSLGADVVISVDVLAHKSAAPAPNAKNASISRSDTGFVAKFGNQHIEIPVDFKALNTQKLPFGIKNEQLIAIINELPVHHEFTLPDEFAGLDLDAKTFWHKFEPSAQMDAQDLAVSDVIIRPDLSAFSVFDTKERTQMMDIGKQSTLSQMHTIKQHIANKTP